MQDYKKEVFSNVALVVVFACGVGLWAYDIELYGDIFRFLPIFLGIFLLYIKEYRGVILLIISAIFVVGLVFILKKTFGYLALHQGGEFLEIARRPINSELNGFPSGHSAPAFLALGFGLYFLPKVSLQYKRWLFLIFILALFVPLSRVITTWHTPFQAIVGSALGVIFGYFLTMIIDKILTKR